MGDSALLVTLVAFTALVAAYLLYGRFAARRVFQLDPRRRTPAHTLQDGVDYVPTPVPVLFGHHFASIAGLGPILGPALAVIWGWLPATLWVVFGSIFLGAVHDLGALAVSLRYQGRSVGDVCREIIGPRARLLFLLIIFFLMSLAMGAFVNAISSLFVSYNPDAIIPSFGLMLVAMGVGLAVYKLRAGLGLATLVGLGLFAGLIALGVYQPVASYQWFASPETQTLLDEARADTDARVPFEAPYGSVAAQEYLTAIGQTEAAGEVAVADAQAKRSWIFLLLGYGFIASVLPVWLLLQPRDYINSFQLYIALGLLVAGLLVASVTGQESATIRAPMLRTDVADAPPLVPFLFVTIACGAISGFHSLVSSGTTVKQLNRETDALPIGFGAMLTEGALAVLVIMACVAGLGAAAWTEAGPYASWKTAGGLAAPLSAVVQGGANFLAEVGIPTKFGRAFLAVTVVAFALTTLDSATRLLRFNVEEICRCLRADWLANRYFGSLVAVSGIAAFGLLPAGKALWVMFGTTNQLLASLTLLTVSLFLYKLGRPVIYTLAPMVLILGMTLWAMLFQLSQDLSDMDAFWKDGQKQLLVGTTVVVLFMTVWLIIEAALSFARGRTDLHLNPAEWDEPQPVPAADPAETR